MPTVSWMEEGERGVASLERLNFLRESKATDSFFMRERAVCAPRVVLPVGLPTTSVDVACFGESFVSDNFLVALCCTAVALLDVFTLGVEDELAGLDFMTTSFDSERESCCDDSALEAPSLECLGFFGRCLSFFNLLFFIFFESATSLEPGCLSVLLEEGGV